MLTINATESTMYLCRATNFIRSANYTVTDSKDFHIFVITKTGKVFHIKKKSTSLEILCIYIELFVKWNYACHNNCKELF